MKEKRRIRNIKILVLTVMLAAGLCLTTTAFAAPKKKPAKGKSSKSHGHSTHGHASGKHGHASKASASHSSRGGKLVPVRDSHGKVKRDRHGRIVYARVAPPKPRPGSEIPASRVGEIQRALATQGFYKGDASGSYDDSTKTAMQSFQNAHSLKATGYPTAQTLKLLGLTKTPSAPGGTAPTTDSPNTRPRTVEKKNP